MRWKYRILISLAALIALIVVITQIVLWSNLPKNLVTSIIENQLGLRITTDRLHTGIEVVPSAVIDIDDHRILDDQQRKLTLVTDGRKLQKSKDPNNQEIAARWSGKQLATDEKGPHGKMSRTYELSYDGTQLYETLHIAMGRSNSTLLVRYVYDAYGPPPAAVGSAPPAAAAPPSGDAPKQ